MLLLLTGWPTNSKSVLGTDSVHHSTTKKKKKSKRFVLGLSWCCLQTLSANARSEYLHPCDAWTQPSSPCAGSYCQHLGIYPQVFFFVGYVQKDHICFGSLRHRSQCCNTSAGDDMPMSSIDYAHSPAWIQM